MYSVSCFCYFLIYKLFRPELMIFFLFSTESSIILCSFSASLYLTFCNPIKSNLYLDISLAAVLSDPDLSRLLTFHALWLMSIFRCLHRSRGSFPRLYLPLLNILSFYSEGLLTPYPTPKLEEHPLSADRDCLFMIFAAPSSAPKRRVIP